MVGKVTHSLAIAFEVSHGGNGDLGSDLWENEMPEVAVVYDYVIQGMSYLSFALLIGVKCLGVIYHGPETYNLVQKATINETIFESALQLALVMRIFLSSGYGTSASVLSAVSSFACLGKVHKRHKEELSKASILGKIFAAASILPVFVFSDIFKLGYGSVLPLCSDVIPVLNILLGIGLPVLGFSITGHLFIDMRVPNITRAVLCEMLVLYQCPAGTRTRPATRYFF